jgi:3-hydroxyacyl-CoA dehydrogenase
MTAMITATVIGAGSVGLGVAASLAIAGQRVTLLARVWPVRKGRPVAFALPPIETAANVLAALGSIAEAVAAGDLAPDEGQAVAAVVEAKRRAIETVDLERRIAALENLA